MSTGISIVVSVFFYLCINFLSYNLALRGYVIESFDFMIYVSKFHLTWLSVFLVSDHSTKNLKKYRFVSEIEVNTSLIISQHFSVVVDIYNSLLFMEHNSLTGIACARPIIYAEGLFASCYLENGQFIPEEGLSKTDLWSILNGDFLKSGSDLVEDFTVSIFL